MAATRTRPAGVLPPGPADGPLQQAVRLHRDPAGTVARARAQFGDVFTLRLVPEGTVVVVIDPDGVRALVDADPAAAHTGEGRRRLLPMVSPRSVLGADGAQHRAARSRVLPAFTAEAMARRTEAAARIAQAHVARWPRERPFLLLPRARALLDDIFARLVIGMSDEGRARALAHAVQRLLWTPGNPPLSPPGRNDGLLGAAVDSLFRRRSRRIAAVLADELAHRRTTTGAAEGDDVLSCLLRADERVTTQEAVDEIIPLLMAGQEPPAAAVTWILDRLGRHADLAEHVACAPAGDPRTDAILREILRVRPPVGALMRVLTEPLETGGHELETGTVTLLPIPALHDDERFFAQPAAFRPDRWLSGEVPADAPFLPFGGGARRCLGEQVAHLYFGTVVPAILRAARVRPLWPSPERQVLRGTVLVPHRSCPVVVRERSRATAAASR